MWYAVNQLRCHKQESVSSISSPVDTHDERWGKIAIYDTIDTVSGVMSANNVVLVRILIENCWWAVLKLDLDKNTKNSQGFRVWDMCQRPERSSTLKACRGFLQQMSLFSEERLSIVFTETNKFLFMNTNLLGTTHERSGFHALCIIVILEVFKTLDDAATIDAPYLDAEFGHMWQEIPNPDGITVPQQRLSEFRTHEELDPRRYLIPIQRRSYNPQNLEKRRLRIRLLRCPSPIRQIRISLREGPVDVLQANESLTPLRHLRKMLHNV